MSYVYAQQKLYPSLVRLYDLHILHILEHEPVGGVVSVPKEYAPWLDELEQTAATLSTEPVSVVRHAPPSLLSYSGLADVSAADLVCNFEELEPLLAKRGPAEKRLLLYVDDMLQHWSRGLHASPEFA